MHYVDFLSRSQKKVDSIDRGRSDTHRLPNQDWPGLS